MSRRDKNEYKFPEPDRPLGYSVQLLQETLGEERWQELSRWLYGQTGAIDEETGQFVIYAYDVRRWLDGRGVID